jgi:Raf kinase inhibitor-like YbhB/YbcL family protein
MKKFSISVKGLYLLLAMILLCACSSASTASPTQVPALTLPSIGESASSTATPTEQTIILHTETISSDEIVEAEGVLFTLSSEAFVQGAPIPARFSCDGENVSPPLEWSDPPKGTESFALVSDDPDAPGGSWVHWILYNIPADVSALPEAISAVDELSDGSRHGENSFGRLDYGGPCPPSGTHHYYFKLYALDMVLELGPGVKKEALLQAMEGHILALVELMGTYTR